MSALVDRIFDRDPTVWVDDPASPEVADRLGWLDTPETMPAHFAALEALAERAKSARRVILAGMGGSSLAPEVVWRTFHQQPGRPSLRLWDSTHPDAVPTPGPDDLILIASKSGTTIETACFEAWAWAATGQAGDRFIAVTDPDTALARRAAERGYSAFINPPDIGGRFSALSLFGLVPAALIGLNVRRLLEGARTVRTAAARWEAIGLALGEHALAGRNKLILRERPALRGFGLWLDQLIAESTGKQGKGIVPIVGDPDAAASDAVTSEVRLNGRDPYDLGRLFYGWSLATAVIGHVLRVNPFDQPDVQDAKTRTAQLLSAGTPPAAAADGPDDLVRLLDGTAPGDYVALLVYGAPSVAGDVRLAKLQRQLRRRTGAVATVAWGPRYLHSSGQLHKGGPPVGRFIVVSEPPTHDVEIPGRPYTFGTLCNAQAAGDVAALRALGRPVVHMASLAMIEALR